MIESRDRQDASCRRAREVRSVQRSGVSRKARHGDTHNHTGENERQRNDGESQGRVQYFPIGINFDIKLRNEARSACKSEQ